MLPHYQLLEAVMSVQWHGWKRVQRIVSPWPAAEVSVSSSSWSINRFDGASILRVRAVILAMNLPSLKDFAVRPYTEDII